MPYRSFLIPVRDPSWAERELNDFIKTHKVLTAERHWVDQGANSFWSVLVDYLESTEQSADAAATASKMKIDYREVLSPEDFEIFAQLRVLRKELAAEDGVALYNIFTNEQLAQIVQGRVCTTEELEQVTGIGQAKVEKYGPRVLEFLSTVWKDSDETSPKAAGENH